MGQPDTTVEAVGVRRRIVLATGYGTAVLAAPIVVVTHPADARAWATRVAALAVAVGAAVLWGRLAAGRGRLPAVAEALAGPVLVAVAGLLFTVTPDGFSTVILSALLGAGVGLAVGPVSLGRRDLGPALLAGLGAVAGLWLLGRWSTPAAWTLAVGLEVGAALTVRGAGGTVAGPPRVRGLRAGALVAGGALLLWTGANDPQLSWFGPVVYHGPAGTSQVALTFDDGPNGEFSLAVARILDERGYKGTFFLVGKALDREPEVARRLLADGQLLGGHSYHHDYWRWLDPRYPELARTDAAFERAVGRCPRFYRPPHGQRTPFVSWAIARHDMTTVMWDVSGADWITDDAQVLARRILRRVRPGSIVLLHDGLDGNPGADRQVVLDALPLVLDGLEQRGLTPVTVRQMVGGPAYRADC
jgi:peptidoglycan-N-acetylglucosamine deacetylase